MAQDEDLKFLRAAVGAPTCQQPRECTHDEGQEEEHRGIVEDCSSWHESEFRTPTRTMLVAMAFVPPARHLLRAKDLADARYAERLTVSDMAREARLSRADFSREFRRTFGEPPYAYLLTRRLERAAALLRNTDRSVAEICFSVGLWSVGSFTSSFTRAYGRSPTAYRASFPPASSLALVPACVVRAYARPQNSTSGEDRSPARA